MQALGKSREEEKEVEEDKGEEVENKPPAAKNGLVLFSKTCMKHFHFLSGP